MAAFDRVLSGIPEMDAALDNIRLGDNVVWEVGSLDEFRAVAVPFAEQALRDGRNLLYIRFAEHEPILPPMEGLRVIQVPLSHRFETFTVDIHNIIEVIFLQYYPVLVNYLLDAIVFLFEGFAIGNEFSFEAEIHPAATRKQR